jgi:hypothetical protein
MPFHSNEKTDSLLYWGLLQFCIKELFMGIPPDADPVGQKGILYSGQTSFDKTTAEHIRSAEIRSAALMEVASVQFSVVPPIGGTKVSLKSITFAEANIGQRQFRVDIQSFDNSPICDGFMCQFSFLIVQ